MRCFWFRLVLAAGPLLLSNAAAAQNPCGYAFSVTGHKLYDNHCAGCHGLDGTGNGPFAKDQRRPPADLTGIAKRNKGSFPSERIADVIRSGGGVAGHEADRDMPVWGKVLNGECGPAYSRRAVVELKRYLEAIQK